jgi:hypothetical protein
LNKSGKGKIVFDGGVDAGSDFGADVYGNTILGGGSLILQNGAHFGARDNIGNLNISGGTLEIRGAGWDTPKRSCFGGAVRLNDHGEIEGWVKGKNGNSTINAALRIDDNGLLWMNGGNLTMSRGMVNRGRILATAGGTLMVPTINGNGGVTKTGNDIFTIAVKDRFICSGETHITGDAHNRSGLELECISSGDTFHGLGDIHISGATLAIKGNDLFKNRPCLYTPNIFVKDDGVSLELNGGMIRTQAIISASAGPNYRFYLDQYSGYGSEEAARAQSIIQTVQPVNLDGSHIDLFKNKGTDTEYYSLFDNMTVMDWEALAQRIAVNSDTFAFKYRILPMSANAKNALIVMAYCGNAPVMRYGPEVETSEDTNATASSTTENSTNQIMVRQVMIRCIKMSNVVRNRI